jgi:hypothetical protein
MGLYEIKNGIKPDGYMTKERYESILYPIIKYKEGVEEARRMAVTSCYKLGLCTYEEMTRL